MLFKAEWKIFLTHSTAIVRNLNERPPGILDEDLKLIGSCVNSVIKEFFYYGSGSLNDLPGCNFITDFRRKLMYNGFAEMRFAQCAILWVWNDGFTRLLNKQ